MLTKIFGKKDKTDGTEESGNEVNRVEVKDQPVDVTVKMAHARYETALNSIRFAHESLSAKQICRALIYAIDHGMDEYQQKPKMQKEGEAILAGVIAMALDFRTIIQGNKMNQRDEEHAKKTQGETEDDKSET